jgi:hypothetical protein
MKLTIGTSYSNVSHSQNDSEIELPSDTTECIAIDIANRIIPISIITDNTAEVVLKNGDVVKGKLVSAKDGVTIKDDDGTLFQYKSYKSMSSINRNIALVNNKGMVTFVFKTRLIRWTPRILVKIEENELRSTLLASISNEYQDLSDLKVNLIGEYQPTPSPNYRRAVAMQPMQPMREMVSMSESSSIAESNEPTGSFAFQTELSHLIEGKTVIPLLEESKVKYQEYYQASIYQGKQLADRIISYQSPDDYPAGEYTFILPSGVQLTSSLPEYQEGQQIKQSVGPSSNVVISTTVISKGDKQIQYKVEIKAIKDCNVIISLPYYNQADTKIISNSKNIKPKVYQEDGDNGWLINHPVGTSSLIISMMHSS